MAYRYAIKERPDGTWAVVLLRGGRGSPAGTVLCDIATRQEAERVLQKLDLDSDPDYLARRW